MATDLSAAVLDETITAVACPASVEGELVICPSRTRLIQASSAVAFRVAHDPALDGQTLDDSNSLYYPANATHDIWPPGVTPGGRAAPTVQPVQVVFAGATADNVTLSFRS